MKINTNSGFLNLIVKKILPCFFVGFSSTLFAQPANDNACTATALTVGTSCSYTSTTSVAATSSTGVPAPGCITGTMLDVWYTAIVPSVGALNVDLQTGTMTDSGMAFYTGTCNSLTLLDCDDDGSANGVMSMLTASGLTPGETIWIRVWKRSGGTGTFSICAQEIPPMAQCGGNLAAGNTCGQSQTICNFDGYCGNTNSAVYTIDTWSQLTSAFCGSINNNSFISFTPSATSFTLRVDITSSTDDLGIQMMVFKTSNCGSGSVQNIVCYSQLSPSASPAILNLSGLTIGDDYYLMVDGWAGDICDYTISLAGAGGISIGTAVTPQTATMCLGSTLELTAAGGDGTYDWSTSVDAADLDADNVAVVNTTPLTVGVKTYTVSSTTTGDCPSTATATITVVGTPEYITGTAELCAGATTTLVNNTAGGTWSSSDPTVATVDATGIVTGVAGGTATISYDICSVIRDTTITVYPNPTVNPITGTLAICEVGTSQLNSTTPLGTWTSQNMGVATVDAAGLVTAVSPGSSLITYTVVTNGCSNFETATVTIDQQAQAISGLAAICANETAQFAQSVLGGTWTTSAPAIATVSGTGFVTAVGAGVATITYSMNNSCPDVTKDITINAIPTVNPISGSTTVCVGTTSDLNNTTPSGTWTSQNTAVATIDASSGLATTLTAGTSLITYTVTTNGCSNFQTTTLTVDQQAQPIVGTDAICVGENTTYSESVGGGTWSSSAPLIATISAGGSINGVSGGNAIITYSLNNTCPAVVKTITINALPVVSAIGGSTSLCNGYTGQMTSSPANGVWTSGNLAAATIDSGTGIVTGVAGGSSLITYTVTTNGCVASQTATVTVINYTPLSLIDSFTCNPSLTIFPGIIDHSNFGGSTNGSWSSTSGPGTVSFADVNNVNTTFTFPSFGTYVVTFTDNTCTNDVATSTIVYSDVPEIDLGSDFFYCPGENGQHLEIQDSINMSSVTWGLSPLPNDPLFSQDLTVGAYNVHLVNKYGCANDATITITTQQAIELIYPLTLPDNGLCFWSLNDTLKMSENIGVQPGQWTSIDPTGGTSTFVNGSATILNPQITFSKYGTYSFVYTEPTCQDDDTITFRLIPPAYYDKKDYSICMGYSESLEPQPLQLLIDGNYITDMEWSTGATTLTISAATEGYYTFALTTGCNTYIDSIFLDVKDCNITMPNVITPNGDGINDYYKILFDGEADIFTEFNIIITNRWGNVVADYNDPKGLWDGTNRSGAPVESGTYFYSVKAVTIQGEELIKQGFLQVIR